MRIVQKRRNVFGFKIDGNMFGTVLMLAAFRVPSSSLSFALVVSNKAHTLALMQTS